MTFKIMRIKFLTYVFQILVQIHFSLMIVIIIVVSNSIFNICFFHIFLFCQYFLVTLSHAFNCCFFEIYIKVHIFFCSCSVFNTSYHCLHNIFIESLHSIEIVFLYFNERLASKTSKYKFSSHFYGV